MEEKMPAENINIQETVSDLKKRIKHIGECL
jgi:hypothetical protein